MKTRISKHGKYEIMEGSYGEMKDLLQPGDILRMLDDVPEGMKRSDYDVRIVRRIPSQEIMDQVMENLPFPSKATAIFAMVESPTEGFSHSWAVQNLKSGMMYIWFGEHDETPCVIKRRIDAETTIQTPYHRNGNHQQTGGSMITSKQINFHGKEYIHYAGTHDELCRMLRVGDLVTMRRHDADNVESVAIVGTVTEICGDVVTVSVAGGECDCITGRQSSKPPFLYAVTAIKRPVENMLPDSPGPWADKDDDTWIVDNDLNAIRVSCDGEWWIGGGLILPSEYAVHAPFKKINIEIIKEK